MKDYLGLLPGLIIIVALLLIDIYVFQLIKTAFQSTSSLIRKTGISLFLVLSFCFYIAFLFAFFTDFTQWPSQVRKYVTGFIIALVASKLTMLPFVFSDDLLRFGKWLISLFYSGSGKHLTGHGITRLQFLNKAGAIAGGAAFGAFIWGVIRTAYNYKIRPINLKLEKLPKEMEGLRIVQISDMHLGSFASTRPVEKFVQIINKIKPDLIFFTGDLVNDLSSEAEPYKDILSKLKSKWGIYSCLGNHDYGNYTTWERKEDKIANRARIVELHNYFGWNLLRNENHLISFGKHTLAIIGVENWGHSDHFPKYGNIEKAVQGSEAAHFKLLLSHDPSHWDYIISQTRDDIDCTFSGHTHGFQFGVEIPALKLKWSPCQYTYKQWAGLYKKGKQQLYVNRGIGFIGYPGRVGMPPEITLFTLKGA